MEGTVVDRLYSEFQDIMETISQAELSLKVTAEQILQKSLLVAAASHFESEVKRHLMSMVRNQSGGNELVLEFVRNKAVERQFHTYFDWKHGRNANQFFGLFGGGFRSYMIERVRADHEYNESIRAFLELEGERNRLVHEDFGNFTLEKTSAEIFDLYQKACLFVDSLQTSFNEYLHSNS